MHHQHIHCESINELENTNIDKVAAFLMIYEECVHVCREGGHVSERVVPGGRSVQQVNVSAVHVMLRLKPSLLHLQTYITHIPDTRDCQ